MGWADVSDGVLKTRSAEHTRGSFLPDSGRARLAARTRASGAPAAGTSSRGEGCCVAVGSVSGKALCGILTLPDRRRRQEVVTTAGVTVTTVSGGHRMVEEGRLSYKGISRPSERRPGHVLGTGKAKRQWKWGERLQFTRVISKQQHKGVMEII